MNSETHSENSGSDQPRPLPYLCRCAVYTRASLHSKSVYSSCEAQRFICADFIGEHRLHGWSLVETPYEDDGESGESLERPALQRLIADIENKSIDRVVIYRVDRLTRRLRDLHTLLKLFDSHGVSFSVVTDFNYGDDAMGRLMLNVVGAAAEFEHDMIKERLADARAYLKSKERRVAGRVPFGYQANPVTRQLEIVDLEAEIIQQFFEFAAAGQTPRQIAVFANEAGLNRKSTTGRLSDWTERQVLKILSNPTYVGFIHHGDSVLPGCHEAVVSPELFNQARAQIQSRKSSTQKEDYGKRKMPLRGVLYCGRCERAMGTDTSHYKNRIYNYYRCRSTAGGVSPCQNVSLSKGEIEYFVYSHVGRDSDGSYPQSQPLVELRALWNLVGSLIQDELIPIIFEKIVYDPDEETVTTTMRCDALEIMKNVYYGEDREDAPNSVE